MDIGSVGNPGHVLPGVPETQMPNWLAENCELIRNVKSVNASGLFGEDSELTFALDPKSRRVVVKIINRKTNQEMAQLPPDYVLQLSRELGQRTGDAAVA